MTAGLVGLICFQDRTPGGGNWLPSAKTQPSKYAYEMYALHYTPMWIFFFGVIVVCQLYETFTAWTYMIVCGGLSLPFLFQPFLCPSAMHNSPDMERSWYARYSTKANLWLAVYSFIGNYWYTHYFYSVLKAEYSMPSHRLNNVPIPLYFATHFYFSTYHVFSNCCLRKVQTAFIPGFRRNLLFCFLIFALSYFTAFMETLTISSFPYYSFEDRNMAYTFGSAFYGIYFIVSFPTFYFFDSSIDSKESESKIPGLWETFSSSCGTGMMIMCLLDIVRLYLGIPLIVGSWRDY